jgi:hypothetical protein
VTAYVVCEGERDAQLLKRLLPEEFVSNVEIVAAGGLSAVKSLAGSVPALASFKAIDFSIEEFSESVSIG